MTKLEALLETSLRATLLLLGVARTLGVALLLVAGMVAIARARLGRRLGALALARGVFARLVVSHGRSPVDRAFNED